MKKASLLAVFSIFIMIHSNLYATTSLPGSTALKEEGEKGMTMLSTKNPYPILNAGVGIPTVTMRFSDGIIGFFDKAAMFGISYTPERFQGWTSDKTSYSYLGLGANIILQKNTDKNYIDFGVIAAYMFRVSSIGIGVGCCWISQEGKAKFHLENFSVAIPITYNFPI